MSAGEPAPRRRRRGRPPWTTPPRAGSPPRANWGTSSYSTQRFGADYRYANPEAVSDAAWYKFDIPATASYRVEVWYPALPGYNTATPYVIVTTRRNQVGLRRPAVRRRSLGNLGTFTLAGGDYNAVGVSRWTSGGAG